MDSSFQEQDSSWAPKQDMSLLCRVCANQQDYLIPIFEGEGLDHDMPTKMQKYLPVKVRETDKLPIQMCYQCASTIIAWSDLVTNCLEADKKLKGMLKINEKNAERKETESTLDDDTYDDSTHFDDTGDVGGGDDASDEDFEKEIKQLISDAGVELPSTSKNTRSTRKRKAEIVSKKSDTKRSKSDTSKAGLLKPKEEVQSGGEDRWVFKLCSGRCNTNPCDCQPIIVNSDIKCDNLLDPVKECFLLSPNPENNESNLICWYCNDSFATKQLIRKHIKYCKRRDHEMEKNKVTIDGRIQYQCPICKVIRARKYSLRNHIVKHSGQMPYTCEQCGKQYSNCDSLRLHTKTVHVLNKGRKVDPEIERMKIKIDGEVRYQCSLCKAILKYKHSLKDHLAGHSEKRLYPCVQCGTKFNVKAHLKRHIKVVHNKIKATICDLCGKEFRTPYSYRMHRRRIHLGERPFVCEICGKSFSQASTLNEHKSVHPEVTDFRLECPQCHKKFYSKTKLIRHSSIHTESRPFACDICNHPFKSKTDVKRHQIVHSDARPYICSICNATYKTAKDLRRHGKSHILL